MKIAIAKETAAGEPRVAAVPDTVSIVVDVRIAAEYTVR